MLNLMEVQPGQVIQFKTALACAHSNPDGATLAVNGHSSFFYQKSRCKLISNGGTT